MSQSGSPHRSRRKDNTSQQGSRDQYSRGNAGKSSNPTKSSSLAKSDKAHGGKHFSNGGSSGGSSGSHEIKVSRNPQSYTSAVSRYSDSDNIDGPSERTHYIAMNLIGQQVRAVLKDGTVYEGLFHNPIFDRGFGVVLHMARKKESGDSGVIRTPPIDVVTVQPQDLVMLDAPEVAFVEDSAEFKKQMMREDTEISGRDFSERELVPWLAPEEAGGMGGLEEDAGARNRWDQFEANERLFGVRTTYDERFYTTEIDRQRVSREVVEKAIRIEREIKHQTTSNSHLAEERGIVAPKDDTEDEEDKYSSVIRDQKGPGPKFGKQDAKGNSAYVVPAKRKQGGEEPSAEERNKKPENDNRDKAREHEFKKQRQRELEIEREREREREKEKEREKARQRERERIDRERAAKGLPPSSPSSNLSRSATSIANLAEEGIYAERALSTSGERPRAPSSPKVASLSNSPGFRQRSFSMSNLGAATAAEGSPAGNLDPDDPQYIEKLRVRQKLLAEMRSQGVEPRAAPEKLKAEPFHSPIVGRPEQIKSLDLSPAVPRVSESVLNEFQQFKDRKRSLSNASPAVPSKQDMVNFSKEIEKKTSAPNSPALRARRGEHQIAPSPLSPRYVLDATAAKLEKEGEAKGSTTTTPAPASAVATPVTTPAAATPAAESPASTSAATTPRKSDAATAAAAAGSDAAKPTAAAATEGASAAESQPPLSKIQPPSIKSKLNPFAKAFTPKRPAAAAPAADKPAGASPPGSAGKPTVDINIPVSSFFSQGMRRLQDNPEDPEQVAPVWPYGRVPYRQEDGGMPMEGYPYPPGRPMGYPVSYVTSPPPQMGSGQPVMMFPPGQPVPRGFVPQGSIPGGPGVYYPGGQPYPPHIYSGPPGAGPAAGGPMGHKGRMGGPYPGPHGHVPPHSPHAPPHSPQGNPQRAGGPQGGVPTAAGGQPVPLAGGPPQGYSGQFPPNSPPAYGVPPPEHGAPHSPHAQPASPHSPHAPRAQPHMVPVSPTQPIYSFPPAPHILGDPLAVPPGRGPHQPIPQQPMVVPGMAPRGGYRYPQGPPPQMARGGGGGGSGEYMNARPEGGGAPNKSPAQAQPFHPRQGNPNVNAGAFYPGQQQQQQQQRGPNQSRGAAQAGGPQQQQQDKERFKVPNTDVLPQQ
ncbi:LsmAD domain containing protein [Acanthamoeba castellanii str. Neff]|uniref:LsmAD domain containing protein n=1 Tax=Acanthamoeba castellanii (strain ATCC 30010 / Neff) TaxID=1257118 RepID=L8GVE5_ACACF|nr:LsmAD domain containing protein [Acanthamoeba castellanii str. Neff]ELR17179.1 LsmAD domain containing protein [Acanthamoeba castellanii str. Neff]